MTQFPVAAVRAKFPALNRPGSSVFFDNAAGAQIPQKVFDAINDHLLKRNVQRGGCYRESQEVDASIAAAREAVACFLNAASPEEVAFGMNATSFIRLVSLALSQTFGERREIVVSDLDHEANIATWLALEPLGAVIRWWKARQDGTLDLTDLEPLLSNKTRLVACTATSNAIGTIVDVAGVARRAHTVGAEVFLDAVHYGPHGPFDVQAWGCDYLVCSGYKIFAPHMGFLWGRRKALDALPTFREDFIPDMAPLKIEVGTFVYENVAGMRAAIEYLTELGNGGGGTRRERLLNAMGSIRDYEATLSAAMIEGLRSIRQATIYGVADPDATHQRVPTLCFNLRNVPPATVASGLAGAGIAVRDGHMYSPRLMRRLGLSPEQGAVRASLVHYNTREEIDRFVGALAEIAPGEAHD
ncbi:MAG TPA: cysteine desulfurase-like protein [Terriglobales bacterium]|nr:cysteine desulfurase-like protein [Terriglobales bacterium]